MADQTTSKKDSAEQDETPRDRFVRLASRRVSATQEDIGKIGLLANKGSYEYNDADVDKINAALQESVRVNIAALRAGKVPKATGFTLE